MASARELLWSLPFRSPFPFPATPNYPIITSNSLPLHATYLNALYLSLHPPQVSPAISTPPLDSHSSSLRVPQITLDNFTRFLIRLLAAESNKALLETQLRVIVLPIHDFDQKWRSLVLATLLPPTPDDAIPPEKTKKSYRIDDQEKEVLLQAHERWKATLPPSTNATVESGQAVEPPPVRKSSEWTIPDQNVGDWVNTLELNESVSSLVALKQLF